MANKAGAASPASSEQADLALSPDAARQTEQLVASFITALGRHRHPDREAAARAR
jgi:hypothetical protein